VAVLAFGAVSAGHRLEHFGGLSGLIVFHEVADEDEALVAGVAFFGSGWCGKVLDVHRFLLLGRAPGLLAQLPGPFLINT
jgi:hypothetical protein